MSRIRQFSSATVVMLVALLPDLAIAAPAQPAPGRTSAQRDRVAQLQGRVQAVAAVEAATVESLSAALGVRFGPPVQVTPYRREWPVLPSDLLADGQIIEAGKDIIVTLTPAPSLELSFEDLAVVLSKLPYYLETRSSHIDAESVATRVYAVDHVFRVKGGVLRVQIPTTLAPDTPNHDVRAQQEGYASRYGTNSRIARVGTLLFRTNYDRPWPDGRTETLEDYRKRKRARHR